MRGHLGPSPVDQKKTPIDLLNRLDLIKIKIRTSENSTFYLALTLCNCLLSNGTAMMNFTKSISSPSSKLLLRNEKIITHPQSQSYNNGVSNIIFFFCLSSIYCKLETIINRKSIFQITEFFPLT